MDVNKTNKLILKSINQLFEYNFLIPVYQRGYRWTHIQVIQLLDDIWNFAKNPPQYEIGKEEPFYCLQPIVVKKNGENWEVIDGQQRLTTIVLIIHYFNEMWLGKQKIKEPKISYETRSDSADFISKLEIDIEDIDTNIKITEVLSKIKLNISFKPEDNIDFYHIANAYKSIHFWVKKMGNELDNNKFQSVFQKNTKVIWYEVEGIDSNNSIDIFTRLNIGKIPLTNAELIKALFLQKGNFSEGNATLKQIQIASEWDIIEKTLQDDSFWFFIYNPNNPLKYDNRIEYIFDLIKKRTKDSENYHTFNEFYKDFSTEKLKNDKPDIDKIWLEIKRYFLSFEEWDKDYVLFHYIGYLVDCGVDINHIKNESSDKKKNEFKEYLKEEIKKQVSCNIEEITYGNKIIKKILLLFNIQTVLETQKSDMRFPFHKYKLENWDIEHISSQTVKTITANKQVWINDILEYFTGNADIQKTENFINNLDTNNEREKEIQTICSFLIKLKKYEKIPDKEFDDIFKLVQGFFKENSQTDEKNNISNLALLDSTTNRSYGNSFFPIKRKRIIENDSKGIFVPIATKNSFLKYYSNKLGEVMYWNGDDAREYQMAIKTALKDFLPKEDSNG